VTNDIQVTRPIAGSAAPALRVRDLEIATSAGQLILDSVTLDIHAGEVLALVGESGCGKTSLGLALLGYSRPGTCISRGQIALGEQDVLKLQGDKLRRFRGHRVAYVPQDPTASLDPRQRIYSQIAEMLEEHPEPSRSRSIRRTVDDLLEQVGLPGTDGYAARYPFELSGGQQQRVTIAMALACRPDFLVLDEPTTGLDVTTQRRILDLVRNLVETTGAGFVYITHDLAVVHDLADRVAVMYAGRIVEVGEKDSVFLSPFHPYTTMLLHSAPRLEAEQMPTGIPGGAPPVGHRPSGCSFAPRCILRTEACSVEPHLRDLGDGRRARCHHVESVPLLTRAQNCTIPKHKTVQAVAPLLMVEELRASHRQGRKQQLAVNNVSFELREGECLALVGESGSGKTTLGRCIAGLHVADSGQLSYRGEVFPFALNERPSAVRRGMQMVFQNPDRCLNPVRSIRDTLARSIRIVNRINVDRIGTVAENLLERVGLPSRILDRYPRELSGGERQRVAIAAALALQPTLLICDEVTSALDVSVQASVVKLLDELRNDGLALIFITHNLALVASIAEHVIVLQGGHVREEGRVSDVLFNPTHSYTKWLLKDLPRISTVAGATFSEAGQ